jgi:hypothetical protein
MHRHGSANAPGAGTAVQAERKLRLLGVDVDRQLRQLVNRLRPDA